MRNWFEEPPRKDDFRWDAEAPLPVEVHEPPTKLESAVRGGLQGLTFGGMPELSTVARTPFSDKPFGTILDEEHAKYKRAEEENPITSMGSEIGAGIIPAAIASYFGGPVGAGAVAEAGTLAKIPRLAKIAKALYAPTKLGGVAATSALSGAIRSKGVEEGDPLQILKDAGKGGVIGYGAGKYIAPVLGKGIQKVGEYGEKIASKIGLEGMSSVLSTALGPSMRAIKARFTRNPEIVGAKPYDELAFDVAKNANKIKQDIYDLSEHAWAQLPDKPLMGVEDALNMVRSLQSKLQVAGESIGGANSMAFNKLADYGKHLESIAKRTPTLMSREVKQILTALDNDINWEANVPEVMTSILRQFRHGLDTVLKEAHPDYKALMEPLADKARLLDEMTSKFRLRKPPNGNFEPSDSTASMLKTATNENKIYSQDILDRYKGNTGQDILKNAEDYELSQQFVKPNIHGTRRTAAFAAAGAAAGKFMAGGAGAVAGAASGAAAGMHLDIKGGQYAGKLIDFLVRNNPEKLRGLIRMRPEAFGKYGPVIENALRRGTAGFAATHFLLQQNDPQYQKTMDNIDEGANQDESRPSQTR